MSHAYETATEANVDSLVSGGKVVVDAFAEWCGPCRGIAPKFAAMAAEFSPKGVSFVKVDVDALEGECKASLVIAACPQSSVNATMLRCRQDLHIIALHHDLLLSSAYVCAAFATKYDISALPSFLFFKDGKVVARFEGASEAKLRSHIESLASM